MQSPDAASKGLTNDSFGDARWHLGWVAAVLGVYLVFWNLPWFRLLGGLGEGATLDPVTFREYLSLGVSAGIKLAAAAAALAVIARSGATFETIGMSRLASWRTTWTRWLLPMLWLALVAALLSSAANIEGSTPSSRTHEPSLTQALAVTTMLLRGLLNPLSEELLYRVFVYLALRRGLGVGAAMVVSSLVFAGVHYNGGLHQQTIALLMGLGLVWVYERTQSLPQAYLLHSSLNLARLCLALSQGHL